MWGSRFPGSWHVLEQIPVITNCGLAFSTETQANSSHQLCRLEHFRISTVKPTLFSFNALPVFPFSREPKLKWGFVKSGLFFFF